MNALIETGLVNAAAAAVLALLVYCVTRVWKNPELAHKLWLLVLLKLVTPPFVSIPVFTAGSQAEPAAARSAPTPPALRQFDTQAAPSVEQSDTIDVAASDDLSLVRSIAGTAAGDVASRAEAAAASDKQPAAAAASRVSHSAGSITSVAPHGSGWLLRLMRAGGFPWRMLVAAGWLAGTLVYFAVAGIRIVRFHGLVRTMPSACGRLSRLADEARGSVGYRGRFDLRAAEIDVPPLVWSVGRPRVVVSRELVEQLEDEELRVLFAHEFAHLVRRDHILRWFELVVLGLYWWNPVAWWAHGKLRQAEEAACDLWVIRSQPGLNFRYAWGGLVSARVGSPSLTLRVSISSGPPHAGPLPLTL